jgi:hypothetical protein
MRAGELDIPQKPWGWSMHSEEMSTKNIAASTKTDAADGQWLHLLMAPAVSAASARAQLLATQRRSSRGPVRRWAISLLLRAAFTEWPHNAEDFPKNATSFGAFSFDAGLTIAESLCSNTVAYASVPLSLVAIWLPAAKAPLLTVGTLARFAFRSTYNGR